MCTPVNFIDTDMVAAIPAPKATPADVAKRIVDGLEQDAVEVLTDDLSINVKAACPARSSALTLAFTHPNAT